jgi:hypothetical protein
MTNAISKQYRRKFYRLLQSQGVDWDKNGVFGNNSNEIYNLGIITNLMKHANFN